MRVFSRLVVGCFLLIALSIGWVAQPTSVVAQNERVAFTGFRTPESVTVGPDGNYYVSDIGRFDVMGDGRIMRITGDPFSDEAEVSVFATGLDDPKGAVFVGEDLIVADVRQLIRVTPEGEISTFLSRSDFPGNVIFLNDMDIDSDGNIFVSDTNRRVIFKVDPESNVTVFHDLAETMTGPNGVIVDEEGHMGQRGSVVSIDLRPPGALLVISPDGNSSREIANGFNGDGVDFDSEGTLYVTDLGRGVLTVDRSGNTELFADGFIQSADFTIQQEENLLIVADLAGRVVFIKL